MRPSRNIADFIIQQRYEHRSDTRGLVARLWQHATPQEIHSMNLTSHYGCVNAIEFSDCGSWLVSGGDDRRVLLWNMDTAVEGRGPVKIMTAEHGSNIFCLGMDQKAEWIYSGGIDGQVIIHDVATGMPENFFPFGDTVHSLSVHPETREIFLAASSYGNVVLTDMRQPVSVDTLEVASSSYAFHSVQWNPVDPRLLITSNDKSGVQLWDIRHPGTCVLQYGRSSSMHSRFNSNGSKIVSIRRRLPPVIYNVSSPVHVCEFDHPGYYNGSTMKSCCFAGPNDEFLVSGSDDFNLYMWRMPEEGDNLTIWQNRAHLVLKGHRSIVNQVRYNCQRAMLASSGVEKMITMWSPFPLSVTQKWRNNKRPGRRDVYSNGEYIGFVLHSEVSHDYSAQSTEENSRVLAFFDCLVQREIAGSESDNFVDSCTNSDSATDSSSHEISGEGDVDAEEEVEEEDRGQPESGAQNQQIPVMRTGIERFRRQRIKNSIVELIAAKRALLVRAARKRGRRLKRMDADQVAKSLRKARRITRNSSQSSSESEEDRSKPEDDRTGARSSSPLPHSFSAVQRGVSRRKRSQLAKSAREALLRPQGQEKSDSSDHSDSSKSPSSVSSVSSVSSGDSSRLRSISPLINVSTPESLRSPGLNRSLRSSSRESLSSSSSSSSAPSHHEDGLHTSEVNEEENLNATFPGQDSTDHLVHENSQEAVENDNHNMEADQINSLPIGGPSMEDTELEEQ